MKTSHEGLNVSYGLSIKTGIKAGFSDAARAFCDSIIDPDHRHLDLYWDCTVAHYGDVPESAISQGVENYWNTGGIRTLWDVMPDF